MVGERPVGVRNRGTDSRWVLDTLQVEDLHPGQPNREEPALWLRFPEPTLATATGPNTLQRRTTA